MNITREKYRSHPALNYSAAKHLIRSPAHFRWVEEHPIEQTSAMVVGTEIHRILLDEPVSVVQKPDRDPADPAAPWDGRKKSCREWLAQNPNAVSFDDFASIHGARDAITRSALAQSILMLCDLREHPIVADYRGILIKGLIDAVGTDVDGKRFIVDLKTTADASQDAFARKARSLSYQMQAFWYCSLLRAHEGLSYMPAFIWLVVETDAPYGVAAYQADEAAMKSGEMLMDTCIDRYADCKDSGKWVGYPAEIQTLNCRW